MSMSLKLSGWAQSSQNPEEVSKRVKGLVLALSGVIIWVAGQFLGIQITADNVVELAGLLGGLAGIATSLYGGILALVTWIAKVRE